MLKPPTQLLLPLTDAADQAAHVRKYLGSSPLARTTVEVLALISSEGDRREVSGQELSELALSESKAVKKAGIGKSGWRRAIALLESVGVLDVQRIATPFVYRVNWRRCAAWIEAVTQEAFELYSTDEKLDKLVNDSWSAPVRSGPAPGVPVNQEQSKHRVFSDSVSCCSSVSSSSTVGAHAAKILRPLPAKPWSASSGITDEHLSLAVVTHDMRFLRHLFDELLRCGWPEDHPIDDTPDARLRFLTLCHHCAYKKVLRKRVGTLVAKVKRRLDVTMCTADSENWAGVWLLVFDDPSDRESHAFTLERWRRRRRVEV